MVLGWRYSVHTLHLASQGTQPKCWVGPGWGDVGLAKGAGSETGGGAGLKREDVRRSLRQFSIL